MIWFKSASVPPVIQLRSPSGKTGRKQALVSYIKDAMRHEDDSAELNTHTSKWESKEIARIFQRLGYDVDVVDYNDTSFTPGKDYDVVFDIHYNIDRLAAHLPGHCVKILHITGSYPAFSVAAELKRVAALEARTGMHYSPRRVVDNVYFTRSLQKADFCTLFGNANTVATFPAEFRSKLHLVVPSAAQIVLQKTRSQYYPNNTTFLWYYGSGAVHKGLDLVLDVFARRTDLRLHVVGNVDTEKDFCKIYQRELFATPHIMFHGFVNGLSPRYAEIVADCFAFVAPSCSESLSIAAAQCLKTGLYPILSRSNGIDLPPGCGQILDTVDAGAIETAIDTVRSLSEADVCEQIAQCQQQALHRYSRENFTAVMTGAIQEALNAKKDVHPVRAS